MAVPAAAARARDRRACARRGARAIVYDVQFTEPTERARGPRAARRGRARAGDVVLATSETDGRGAHQRARRRRRTCAPPARAAAASNLPTDPGGVIRALPRDARAACLAGRRGRAALGAPASRPAGFDDGGAWIDYRGPPGHDPDLLVLRPRPAATSTPRGCAARSSSSAPPRRRCRTSTPTPDRARELMSGPEVQANAIWTALHGFPLRDAPAWARAARDRCCSALAARRSPRLRAARARRPRSPRRSSRVAYALVAQLAFGAGLVLAVAAPLLALALGTLAADRRRLPRRAPRAPPRGRGDNDVLEEARARAHRASCARPSSRSSTGSARPPSRATATPASTSSA